MKLTEEMLEEKGSRILDTSITTDDIINFYGWGDNEKPLKLILSKGFINDWCIYVESMDREQTYEEVKR